MYLNSCDSSETWWSCSDPDLHEGKTELFVNTFRNYDLTIKNRSLYISLLSLSYSNTVDVRSSYIEFGLSQIVKENFTI